MQGQALSVSQLNQYIKDLMDADPILDQICVRGELSNYKIYPSGHHYFTLKDAESSLRGVMFRSHASRLRFRPESGMSVTVWGKVSVFPRDGAYQLYAAAISPEGAGDLQVAFEQRKEQLAKEGLFDPAHKKSLPRFPRRIAVITRGVGAAVRDIIRILGQRWPLAEVLVLPVRVQGAEAPPEIAGAIRYANRWNIADLIITGRGGGSIEDLWAFNEEAVARAIYDSDIPVISAVGHEPDVTIADFVADLRASTPSNAAELAVPDIREIRQQLTSWDQRMETALEKRLQNLRSRLTDLQQRRVLQSPQRYLDQKRQELDYLQSKLLSGAERKLAEARQRQTALAAKLDALSPLKVLGRGYALAADTAGRLLRDPAQVCPGDTVNLRLEKGSLRCQVLGGDRHGDKKDKSQL